MKKVKKSIEKGRFRTRVFMKVFGPFRPKIIKLTLVMLPGNAVTEKLLT